VTNDKGVIVAVLLDGKRISTQVRSEVAQQVECLRTRGINPSLKVVLVGDDPASQVYVRNKARKSAEVGIDAETIRLPSDASAQDILAKVMTFNLDDSVDGILVQLPLPSHVTAAQTQLILNAIDPLKDVDGLHPVNLGRLLSGQPGLVPCTPTGCMRLIESTGIELNGSKAVVIGRSTIVGKPIGQLLLAQNATVTLCHSRTRDIEQVCRGADVVVAAVGKPNLVHGSWIKPGAVVIDVGINRLDTGKLCGDVHFSSASEVAGYITPVPGGVGPMTIAYLLSNVVKAAEMRRDND
jgi:methylenetetrahydrofolate dehydrogenase (NADP+) / methenyltetrahydrofolate cyclohydrolase